MPSRYAQYSQVAKEVNENYNSLVNLFERIQFFLQRLNACSEIPYSPRMKGLLWDIMAEVLSTLAVFTQRMKETPMSGSDLLMHPALADHCIEKFVKGLVRRTHLEDVPQRLNRLTNEETLIEEGNLKDTQHDDDGEVVIGELVRSDNDALNVIQEQKVRVDGNEVNSRARAWFP